MNFGAIGKGLKDQALSKINLGPADALKGAIADSGIKISAADIKALINDPNVKQALTNAIAKIAMSKVGGLSGADQKAVDSNLMSVAGEILKKAPDAGMSQKEVAGSLQDTIKSKLGIK